MSNDLRTLIEMSSRLIEKIFYDRGEIQPMYHCFYADGRVGITPAPVADKATAMIIMREFFELEEIVKYLFISEAWTLLENKDVDLDYIRKYGIADHPNRREVILFVAEDQTAMLMASRAIKRSTTGKATLGPLDFKEHTKAEGRMVGLLPRGDKVLQ